MLGRHVFLIGMPGSGKSSLGKRAARESGLRFTDMDERITETAGMPVEEIFAAYGEKGFRQAETNLLCAMTRWQPTVISTGGGVVLSEVNRKIMRDWGLIVLVDRPLEDILGDIRMETRPLLKEGGPERLRKLYEERMPLYRDLADYTLKNDQGYMPAVQQLIRVMRDRFGA